MSYRLSQKNLATERDDVLHRNPAFEECNLDDTQHDEEVDDATAVALVQKGVNLCANCFIHGVFDEGVV